MPTAPGKQPVPVEKPHVDSILFLEPDVTLDDLRSLAKQLQTVRMDVTTAVAPAAIRLPSAVRQDAVKRAFDRLPFYLNARGFTPLTPDERVSLEGQLDAFLTRAFERPVFDVGAIARAAEFAQMRGGSDGPKVLFEGEHALVLADQEYHFGEGPEHGILPESLGKAALVVDVILEVIGTILGVLGLVGDEAFHKAAGSKSLVKALAKWLENKTARDALAKFLKAIRERDIKGIVLFLDALEGAGNLGEFFAHIFANLSKLDYALTIIKILAWLAAVLSGAGAAALLIKIVAAIVDLIGLALKLPELEKAFG